MAIDAAKLLPKCRMFVRQTNTDADEELIQTISACEADLFTGGVNDPDGDDPLVQQAVKLYCKANFGYDQDAEKYQKAYEHVKSALALCRSYNT